MYTSGPHRQHWTSRSTGSTGTTAPTGALASDEIQATDREQFDALGAAGGLPLTHPS
jgi:hypothetical protein